MSIHDRIIITIAFLTLIAGGVSLVGYAQTEGQIVRTLADHPGNTIYYINDNSTGAIDGDIKLLFDSNTFLTQYMDVMTQTGEIKKVYDLLRDDSVQKYVSRYQSFNDITYTPSDLVILKDPHLIIQGQNIKLRREAAESLSTLAGEFHEIFGKKIVIVSAYRSYNYQKSLKKKGCSDTLCAPAGHSEHQGGLAIDLFAATNAGDFLSKKDFKKYYLRLSENAHRYGRHNTYQKGVEIDTYQPEPRHWRYVGRDLATELYEQQMTFAERIQHNDIDFTHYNQ